MNKGAFKEVKAADWYKIYHHTSSHVIFVVTPLALPPVTISVTSPSPRSGRSPLTSAQ